MTSDRTKQQVARTEPEAERLLVCVGPHPSAERLVQATDRMAKTLGVSWSAIHVETPREERISQADREQVNNTLHLVEVLGGEAVTVAGQNVADEAIAYARSRNVSRIVVGKSQSSRWPGWLRASVADQLIRNCDDIDVHIMHGDTGVPPTPRRLVTSPAKLSYANYLGAILVVALCTGLGFLMFPYLAPPNIIMVYLLGVVVVSLRFGRGPSVLASVLSVAAFDFFFIPPYLTFTVDDKHYFVIFAVMLFTGLVISTLTSHLRFQVESARSRERRTAAIYAMSRDLVHVTSISAVIETAASHIGKVFDAEVVLALPEDISLDMRRVGELDATTTQGSMPDQPQ